MAIAPTPSAPAAGSARPTEPAAPRPGRRGTAATRDWTLIVLSIAILAGAALRFATLGQQSFDEDETVTVWLMHLSLPKLLAAIPHTESTPPLYYILAWGWTHLCGTGAVGIRSLSALIGVAAIPVCYLAARELFNRRAGAVAAALAALSPALIWYSQEARAYELLILTSGAALLFFARSLRALDADRGAPRLQSALALWAVAASLSLLSHYFAAFLVGPQALWLLVAVRRRRPQRRPVLIATGAVAAVGLALLPLALHQASNGGTDWIGIIPLGGRLEDVPPQMMLGEGRPFYHLFGLALGVAATLPALIVLARGGRRASPRRPWSERRAVLIPVTVGVCGLVLPTLVDLAGKKIMIDRNTLGAGVVLLIACAAGIASHSARWIGPLALVAVLGLFAWDLVMVDTDPLHQREDWRDAAHALGQPALTRAIVYGPATNNPAPAPPLVPFQAVYLKSMLTMPDRGFTVREIDVLNVRDDLSDTSPPPDPVSPGRGFHLVARTGGRVYTLFRFRSPRPVHVTPDELIGDDLLDNRDEGDTLVGLQIPRRSF